MLLSSISGNGILAQSAQAAPTNSGDVSAIASAYQVVSATATQLYAGTAYVTSVNEAPLSATRAGNAANASLANSAWYDGTGRFISSLPDSATVSAIASSYAESAVSSKLDSSAASGFYTTANESGFVGSSYVDSAVSGKQDTITFGYDGANISSIDGSALAGGGGGGAAFPAYITTGANVKAEITTGFQGSTSTRPTLFISGTPTSNAYPRMLLSENHTAATCKSSTYLADAFEFYTGDPGSAGDKIFRADTAQVSASGRFVINSSYVSGAEGWRYGSSEYEQLTGVYDTVSSNSATWGGGGIDSATCSAIASSYAESAVSSKADSSALSSYVPYSSLEYNTASAISGINGSALAGTTYSAGTGIDITDDVISVEAPVDIVAGPGIVIDNPDGNTLRVSTDLEYSKVLYSSNTVISSSPGYVYPMTESMLNFERIRVWFANREFTGYQCCHEFYPTQSNIMVGSVDASEGTGNSQRLNMGFSANASGNLVDVFHNLWYGSYSNPSNASGPGRGLGILRVDGIHRIANN